MLLKAFIKKCLISLGYEKLIQVRPLLVGNYLDDYGWFESIKTGMPIDKEGNSLPWISYPAIDFLKERVHKKMKIFEYGCGGSTLWWSERVEEVTSVEHDLDWYNMMKKRVKFNVNLSWANLEYGGVFQRSIKS